ncbi:hypothetical protein ACHAXT_004901 [Thalassiosira profunda]
MQPVARQRRRRLLPSVVLLICVAFVSSFADVSTSCMRRRFSLSSSTHNDVMAMPEPPPTSPSHSLYHLILQNRLCKTNNCKSIPLAGVHDALSGKIFAQHGAPALFVSGFGVSASLLGLPDAGMTNLVEMEMMARNICSIVQISPDCRSVVVNGRQCPPPIICDGDTGYGGAPNMLRTISALGNAGVAAVSIEDQTFPKRCAIAAGSSIQIVNREDAIERVRGALGARDQYVQSQSSFVENSGAGPWIVARTDCRMSHGFQEVLERCLRFEELGAEIIYGENLQSREEYRQLRERLDPRTVTVIAQVQETTAPTDAADTNSKPLLSVEEIGALGYDLALFGVTPLQVCVGALESAAKDFLDGSDREATGIIGNGATMADFATVKQVVGFDELQAFETEFPCSSSESRSSDAFSLPDENADEDVITHILEDEEDEPPAPLDVVNGTSDGYVVTQQYTIPEGFPETTINGEGNATSLSSIFSPEDIKRLRLTSRNVTLPAALMLLDPEQYLTQSRARKVIRQRSICICRNRNAGFNELGRVISRIYPGDIVGFQKRAGADYYAEEGVPYRPPPFDLPVVYEDDHMAVVNKPAGVVVYRSESEGGRGSGARGGGHGRDTLLSALPYVLTPSNISVGSDDGGDDDPNIPLRRPQPVHRLDRPTSGLVVVAKTKAAAVHLSQQFEHRKVRKTYTAIVNGCPEQQCGELSPDEWNVIDHDLEEKTAITKWKVLREVRSLHAKNNTLALVELKPLTGRYHQLRRHMAWVCGTPLVGDSTYDGADEAALRLRGRGLFLCSNEIELEHPYYNTPSGRQEWEAERGDRDALVWEDKGTVMVRARIDLPSKFESFIQHEGSRAAKMASTATFKDATGK